MKINDIELKWLGHDGFQIKNHRMIYIDPFNIKDSLEKADIILITHSHYDHCSLADIEKIVKEGTKIICPADCQSTVAKSKITLNIQIVEPGQEMDLQDVKISAIPAYNIDKNFHPKTDGWVGYVIKMNDAIIYHAGDTDMIPEMQKLTGYKQQSKEFIALLPVSGRYVMTAEEASEAANVIKPTLAIPMHWGGLIGTEQDAKDFKDMCSEKGIKAEILQKE